MKLSPSAQWVSNAIIVAGSAPVASGSGLSSLNTSHGIRIVDGTTLYIADKDNHRVVVIKPGSNNATAIIGTAQGAGVSQFSQPTDIFVTSAFVYVLDAANYRVQMWPRNGSSGITVAGTTGSTGNSSSNNTFGFSYGIHVDKDGFIYVSDQPNHRVLRFPPGSNSGTVVAGTGFAEAGPSQVNGAYRIFVDDTKSIFIADTYNHRIQKWTCGACSGVTVAGTGTVGTTDNQLYYPVAVLVDSNQYMYIGDQGNNRVHRWLVGDCSGQCLVGCTGTYGPAAHQFYYLQSVAFDSQGAMYVSDGGNHRVQKFMLVPVIGMLNS